jgi:hypothetical protein
LDAKCVGFRSNEFNDLPRASKAVNVRFGLQRAIALGDLEMPMLDDCSRVAG